MFFDTMSIFAYVTGIILLYFFCWLFINPLKWFLKLVLNTALGGLILVAINFFGSVNGLYIPITPLSSLITGLLGVPGVAMLVILQFIL